MDMKRKKFLIIFGSVCLSIIVLCAVFAILFRLKTVNVEIRSRAINTNLPAEIQNRVYETGEFSIGKNIVFMNFDDNIEKIEKSNPYVKVEQVIRRFPNKVTIYISERTPKYRVKDDANETNYWYILDEDFKLLDKVTEGELKTKQVSGDLNYYKLTTEITKETLTLESKTAIIGGFVIDANEIKSLVNAISTGAYAKTTDNTVIRSINYLKTSGTFEMSLRNSALENEVGCKIVITGADNLYEKVLAGMVVYNEGNEENVPDVTITISKDANGKYYGVSSRQ